MNASLQIQSREWSLWESDGLKLFLPRVHRDECIYFQTDWSFVPSGIKEAAVTADTPKLRIRLIGYVPSLRDWRDLENQFLGFHEPIDATEETDNLGPDMWIWQPGEPEPLGFGHWETDLKFGERRGREFDFTFEAFRPTERVSKFRVDYAVKQFFKEPVPPDWELPEWLDEGEGFEFEGSIELKEILCEVPFNCARPIEVARQLARRELAEEQFGPGSVHDKNCPGKYKPEDVSATGRYVLLHLADE